MCCNTHDCLCMILISPIPTNINSENFFSKFSFLCFISKSSQKDLQKMMHSGFKLPSKLEAGANSHDGLEKWPVPDTFSLPKAVLFMATVEVFLPPPAQWCTGQLSGSQRLSSQLLLSSAVTSEGQEEMQEVGWKERNNSWCTTEALELNSLLLVTHEFHPFRNHVHYMF